MIFTGSLLFQYDFVTGVVSPTTSQNHENLRIAQTIANGIVVSTADQLYVAQRTVTNNSTPLDLDLNGGSTLIGIDRTAFSCVEIVGFGFINLSTTQILTVGGTGNTFTTWLTGTNPGIVLPASADITSNFTWCCFMCPAAAAWGVTASSGDTLRFTTSGASANNFLTFLLGRSA